MQIPTLKPVVWVGPALREPRGLPDEVQDAMGYALFLAQTGTKHRHAEPLKGFGGGGVLEIIEDHAGNTYRAVYTVRFQDAVYVLHAFQKKARHGISTPKHAMELIGERLKQAETLHAERTRLGGKHE